MSLNIDTDLVDEAIAHSNPLEVEEVETNLNYIIYKISHKSFNPYASPRILRIFPRLDKFIYNKIAVYIPQKQFFKRAKAELKDDFVKAIVETIKKIAAQDKGVRKNLALDGKYKFNSLFFVLSAEEFKKVFPYFRDQDFKFTLFNLVLAKFIDAIFTWPADSRSVEEVLAHGFTKRPIKNLLKLYSDTELGSYFSNPKNLEKEMRVITHAGLKNQIRVDDQVLLSQFQTPWSLYEIFHRGPQIYSPRIREIPRIVFHVWIFSNKDSRQINPNELENLQNTAQILKSSGKIYDHILWVDKIDAMSEKVRAQLEIIEISIKQISDLPKNILTLPINESINHKSAKKGSLVLATDLLRLVIMNYTGGIYMDVNYQLFKNPESFLKYSFFSVDLSSIEIPNYCFGAKRKHPLILEAMEIASKDFFQNLELYDPQKDDGKVARLPLSKAFLTHSNKEGRVDYNYPTSCSICKCYVDPTYFASTNSTKFYEGLSLHLQSATDYRKSLLTDQSLLYCDQDPLGADAHGALTWLK